MQILKWIRILLIGLSCVAFSPVSLAADEPADTPEEVVQVDINTADAETIAAVLEGVGLVRAREIVAYRELYGRFTSVDELIEVQGIGPATVERNRHRILIESE